MINTELNKINPTITDVQQFWDARPCNVRHSNHALGSIDYFDEVEKRKFFVEPHIVSFSEFPKWAGKRVLEIGCGIGTAAVNFVRNGAIYSGVELSGTSLHLTRQRFKVYNLSGEFYQANAEELSSTVPIQPYDLIYSWGVLHHSPRPDLIMAEIKKYLASGSTLKLMVYATNSWKNYMIDAGLDQPEAQSGCPIAYTYTHDELLRMLGKDFDIVDIHQDHIFPYQVEPYKNKQYIQQPWFEAMPLKMLNVLQQKLGWHLMVTATLK